VLVSKTPYRISFFGGGTDYPEWYLRNGGEIVSTTINKYIYISCKQLPPFFDHKYRVSYSKIEEVKNYNKIQHKVISNIIKIYKHKLKNIGLEIHYNGDLPSKSGMGSSSCFVVGMINLLNTFVNNKIIDKKKLAKESIFFEQSILKETVGIQDQIAATYGGLNKIKINKKGNFEVSKLISNKQSELLLDNIYLVFTKINRTAETIAKSYVKNLNKNNDIYHLQEITKNALINLKSNKFDEFGEMLHETWLIKKKLSEKVSNHKIDSMYLHGLKNGASGGKVLGAGGGGFLMFYVKREYQKKFERSFKNFFYFKPKLDINGSKILNV